MAKDLHQWSIRWMEAERDAATDQAGRVAAAQAHLDRMRTVESGKMVRKELADHLLVRDLDERKIPLVEGGVDELREGRPDDAQRYREVARYFRLEAEARLAREKASRSANRPARSQAPHRARQRILITRLGRRKTDRPEWARGASRHRRDGGRFSVPGIRGLRCTR